MPRKVRDGVKDLKKAGFVLDRQKGSHRFFKYGKTIGITISGHDGDDLTRPYEKQIKERIAEAEREKIYRQGLF